MSSTSIDALVARSLDAPVELREVLPDLFSDVDELGVGANRVVSLMREAALQPGASVLDLGCGKGTSAIALAASLGVRVRGIEAVPEFVESASRLAQRTGVSDHCHFTVGNLLDAVRVERGHDAALLLALGDVLGELEETARALLRCVRPGGVVVLDDAYLVGAGLAGGGRDDSLRQLRAAGATVVAEVCTDGDDELARVQQAAACVLDRARSLAAVRPDLELQLLEFAHRQVEEVRDPMPRVAGVLWLLRRS